jgi:hypothetical protein
VAVGAENVVLVVQGEQEDQQAAQRGEEREEHEDPPVALAHAVVDEGAMVVQVDHALVALGAVDRGQRLVHQARAADAEVDAD